MKDLARAQPALPIDQQDPVEAEAQAQHVRSGLDPHLHPQANPPGDRQRQFQRRARSLSEKGVRISRAGLS